MSIIDEQDAARQRLAERTAALAAKSAVPDDYEQPELEPVPSTVPTSGFVDLVFDEGRLLQIRDPRGLETEIGHWLDEGGRKVLRIPHGVQLPSPTRNRAGAAHAKAGPTERKAAYLQAPKSGTARAKVLAAFINDWKAGGDGMIDEDVDARTGLGLYTAAPRRLELVQDGWLRASGSYGRTKKAQPSIKWELTPEGVERLGLRRS